MAGSMRSSRSGVTGSRHSPSNHCYRINLPILRQPILDCQDNELVALLRAPALWSQDTAANNIQPLNHGLVSEAQQLISAQFPPYAVPSRFFIVNQFELVPASGKINRRALPSVADIAEFHHADAAPPASVIDDGGASLPPKCSTCAGRSSDQRSTGMMTSSTGRSLYCDRTANSATPSGGLSHIGQGLLSETRTAAAIAELPTQTEDARDHAESTVGAQAGPNAHSETSEQTGRAYEFRHFTALQALSRCY